MWFCEEVRDNILPVLDSYLNGLILEHIKVLPADTGNWVIIYLFIFCLSPCLCLFVSWTTEQFRKKLSESNLFMHIYN